MANINPFRASTASAVFPSGPGLPPWMGVTQHGFTAFPMTSANSVEYFDAVLFDGMRERSGYFAVLKRFDASDWALADALGQEPFVGHLFQDRRSRSKRLGKAMAVSSRGVEITANSPAVRAFWQDLGYDVEGEISTDEHPTTAPLLLTVLLTRTRSPVRC